MSGDADSLAVACGAVASVGLSYIGMCVFAAAVVAAIESTGAAVAAAAIGIDNGTL